jgi:hypothetical protein
MESMEVVMQRAYDKFGIKLDHIQLLFVHPGTGALIYLIVIDYHINTRIVRSHRCNMSDLTLLILSSSEQDVPKVVLNI